MVKQYSRIPSKGSIAMFRFYFATLLFLFGSVPQAANLPPELTNGTPIPPEKQIALISRLLGSGEIVEQAWGIHLAAKNNHPEFVQEFYKFLIPVPVDQRLWDPLKRVHDLNRVVLDSLIQLNVKVSAEPLLPFFDMYPDALIVLFSKNLNENIPTLLSLASTTKSSTDWCALNNLLANARAPGLALQMLKELEIEVRVGVRDDPMKSGLPEVGFGGGCGDGWVRITEGFPPTGIFELTPERDPEGILFSNGPVPIYLRRSVATPKIIVGTGSCSTEISWNQCRLMYLAQMLGIPSDSLGLEYREDCFIQWQGIDSYNRDVAEFLNEEKEAFAQIVKRLVEKGLLDSDEAGKLQPRIKIFKVVDLRKDQSIPLPAPPGTN
jgi:hypothetical protein